MKQIKCSIKKKFLVNKSALWHKIPI